MAERALDVYLNDHLAGAMMGCDLAEQIRDRNPGTSLGELMGSLAREIEEDRETLAELMERLGTTGNPVKQGVAWLAEKASRVKLSGASSGHPELGTFLALEALELGVGGKLCLWRALAVVAEGDPHLGAMDLASLIERAETQHAILERERLAAGSVALRDTPDGGGETGRR